MKIQVRDCIRGRADGTAATLEITCAISREKHGGASRERVEELNLLTVTELTLAVTEPKVGATGVTVTACGSAVQVPSTPSVADTVTFGDAVPAANVCVTANSWLASKSAGALKVVTFGPPSRVHHSQTETSPEECLYNKFASVVMQNLGIGIAPPHPGSAAADLGLKDLAKHWSEGAIAPISFSAMVASLIKDLPIETRRLVGEFFIESAVLVEDMSAKNYELIGRLIRSIDPSLHCYPNRAIIGINLFAPQRAIVAAIKSFVKAKKTELDIPEQRRRFEKMEEYLKVWDLREGWVKDHYEIDAELGFASISRNRSDPERTVANNYYSAFEMISGHKYSFEKWVRLSVFSKIMTQKSLSAIRRRIFRDPLTRPKPSIRTIPASTVSPNFEELVSDANDSKELFLSLETIWDIESLIPLGNTNYEIIQKLGMIDAAAANEFITNIRNRIGQSADTRKK